MNRDCHKIRDHLCDSISGLLSETEDKAVQEHLKICADCRRYAEALEQEHALLANHFAGIDADMASRHWQVVEAADRCHTQTEAETIARRRPTMKHRLNRIAIAAGIILAAAIGIHYLVGPFQTTNTAYGMTDLPTLLGNVATLHVQSTLWMYRPDPNRPGFEEATVIPSELWVDVPNLRMSFTAYMSWSRPDGQSGLNRLEGVHTAEYAMDIDHTEKTVWFNKVSPVQQRLAIRDQIQRYLHQITEEQLDQFVPLGQETINGILYTIWERQDTESYRDHPRQRIRCWMAPATGELRRMYLWREDENSKWRLTWCADTIERDIEIPDAVFDFNPPKDYRYQNTLETAFEGEGLGSGWYAMDGARVCVAVSFTLDDGSMIVAWHSDDLEQDRYADQSQLFEGLVPGGNLPALPMVVYGLKTIPLESYSPPERTYTGRHLAYTKKNGWYYEWALFVPDSPVPAPTGSEVIRMLCRFNLPNEQPPQVGNPVSRNAIKASEFDDFVRAAMAELSDNGTAPEHVTSENVMTLAQQIRSAIEP